MAVPEIEPLAEPQTIQISILSVLNDKEVVHHLILDGRDTGVIDWEESPDGSIGFIDGLDAEAELDNLGIRKLAWIPIAQCMKGIHPNVHTIEHLDGVVSFIESADLGLGDSDPSTV